MKSQRGGQIFLYSQSIENIRKLPRMIQRLVQNAKIGHWPTGKWEGEKIGDPYVGVYEW